MSDKKTLPNGFTFKHKMLMGKPAVLIMRSDATATTDGVLAVAPGDTFPQAEQEALRRFYDSYDSDGRVRAEGVLKAAGWDDAKARDEE